MKFRAFIAGIVGAFAISSAAMAADAIVIPPPAAPAPVAVAPAGFDWAGIYAGANAYVGFGGGGIVAGAQVGFNFVRGNLLFGAEAVVDGVFTGGGSGCCIVSALAKVGFLLGATDRILVYGAGGVFGIVSGGGSVFTGVLGGGAAIGIGDRLSLFGEFIFSPAGGVSNGIGRVGVNFHFGN